MELKTNDKGSFVLEQVRTRKNICFKTRQSQISYKYIILKASGNSEATN